MVTKLVRITYHNIKMLKSKIFEFLKQYIGDYLYGFEKD